MSSYCVRITNVSGVKEFADYLSSHRYGTCVDVESPELKNSPLPLIMGYVIKINSEKKKVDTSSKYNVLVLQIRTVAITDNINETNIRIVFVGDIVEKLSNELKINDFIAVLKPKKMKVIRETSLYIGPRNAIVFLYSLQPNLSEPGVFSLPESVPTGPTETFIGSNVVKKDKTKATKSKKWYEKNNARQSSVKPSFSKDLRSHHSCSCSKKSCNSDSCEDSDFDEEEIRNFLKFYKVYKSVIKCDCHNRSSSRSKKCSCSSERSRSKSQCSTSTHSGCKRRNREQSLSPSTSMTNLSVKRYRSESSGNNVIDQPIERDRSVSPSSYYTSARSEFPDSNSNHGDNVNWSTQAVQQSLNLIDSFNEMEFPESNSNHDDNINVSTQAVQQSLFTESPNELTLENEIISSDNDSLTDKSEPTIALTEAMIQPPDSEKSDSDDDNFVEAL